MGDICLVIMCITMKTNKEKKSFCNKQAVYRLNMCNKGAFHEVIIQQSYISHSKELANIVEILGFYKDILC